jgi:hypothetical protein
MAKQIVPANQWQPFFQHLSAEYAQKLATLEMVPETEGPQLVTFDQPFGGITTEDVGGRTTLTIHLGEESDLTLETPLRVYSTPFAGGGGQIIEIEVASMPLTRLYLAQSAEQSTGRGEIYGGAAERSVGQEAAPGRAYGDGQPSGQAPDHAGFVSEAERTPADPPRSYINEASRAAGIVGEANTGGGYGPPADRDPAGQRDSGDAASQSDTTDTAHIQGARLGIGLGGVQTVGGGSLGDRDLSGRTPAERIDLDPAIDMQGADVVDLGRGAGVIDTTRDPIGGTGDEDNGMDVGPNMVEGEVGAQAERDLTELFGKRRAAGAAEEGQDKDRQAD